MDTSLGDMEAHVTTPAEPTNIEQLIVVIMVTVDIDRAVAYLAWLPGHFANTRCARCLIASALTFKVFIMVIYFVYHNRLL